MAAFLNVVVILLCLWDAGSSISYQETRKTERISKARRFEKPCLDRSLCPASDHDNEESLSNLANKNCRSDADCTGGEYCHTFHRICLRPRQPITVAPVKTSLKRCSRDLDCKTIEYCHDFWKICLPSQKVHEQPPPTKRQSWYCRTSKDCKIDERCHKHFHACYKRPSMSAVRRDTGNSRRCDKTSDCGTNFYCHDHFRICLQNTITVTKSPVKTTKAKTCDQNTPCPKGMLCHNFWNICYTPPPVVNLPQNNKTQQCQIDSDCKPDEFCHTMAAQSGHVVARQRRNILRMCRPRKFRQLPKSSGDTTCNTDADCGPNKCCLGNLGVCMAYKLPGEMCLTEKTDFVCPCASGSYCKARGKWASPRRIINKMQLPQTAANHFLKASNKKKHKVGKCTPSSF